MLSISCCWDFKRSAATQGGGTQGRFRSKHGGKPHLAALWPLWAVQAQVSLLLLSLPQPTYMQTPHLVSAFLHHNFSIQ